MATITSKSPGSYKAGTQVTNRGPWTPDTPYLINDAVSLNGRVFVAQISNQNRNPVIEGPEWRAAATAPALVSRDVVGPRYDADQRFDR